MAAIDPGSIIDSIQKIYDVAMAIKDQIALYKNIEGRLKGLSNDLIATADLVKGAPLAKKDRNYIIVNHLNTFVVEATCVVKVLAAQKSSVFKRLKTFAFAGKINLQIDVLVSQLADFRKQYSLVQLDNLAQHLEDLPKRLAQAMIDADKTAKSMQNAQPQDVINTITDATAREFWKKNFKDLLTVAEASMEKPFYEALQATRLYNENDLARHFKGIYECIMDEMDANNDDFITIFEYRTYCEDSNMTDQFEQLWLAAGHSFTRKVKAQEEQLPSIKPRRPPPGLTPQMQGSANDLAQVMQVESALRKRMTRELGIDVVFVVDCTSSMGKWLIDVSNKIQAIHDYIAKSNATIRQRFAFVGYRDFNDAERFSSHPFTTAIPTLTKFIANVDTQHVTPPTDTPEDVLGGLKSALRLNWAADFRLVVLVGDAPCHGRDFYVAKNYQGQVIDPKYYDFYPDGDPEVRIQKFSRVNKVQKNNALGLVEQLAIDNIDFVMCRIPNRQGEVITDVMMTKFKAAYDKRGKRKAQIVEISAEPAVFVDVLLNTANSNARKPPVYAQDYALPMNPNEVLPSTFEQLPQKQSKPQQQQQQQQPEVLPSTFEQLPQKQSKPQPPDVEPSTAVQANRGSGSPDARQARQQQIRKQRAAMTTPPLMADVVLPSTAEQLVARTNNPTPKYP